MTVNAHYETDALTNCAIQAHADQPLRSIPQPPLAPSSYISIRVLPPNVLTSMHLDVTILATLAPFVQYHLLPF
uniref:Uncharacterized protein n=1 Tax=Mesocestoides corti TaxID=53468 RepID=A0A5K3G2D7_MESCO